LAVEFLLSFGPVQNSQCKIKESENKMNDMSLKDDRKMAEIYVTDFFETVVDEIIEEHVVEKSFDGVLKLTIKLWLLGRSNSYCVENEEPCIRGEFKLPVNGSVITTPFELGELISFHFGGSGLWDHAVAVILAQGGSTAMEQHNYVSACKHVAELIPNSMS
jgi:hypothetical protein